MYSKPKATFLLLFSIFRVTEGSPDTQLEKLTCHYEVKIAYITILQNTKYRLLYVAHSSEAKKHITDLKWQEIFLQTVIILHPMFST